MAVGVFSGVFLFCAALASGLERGQPAPAFSVKSGDDRELSLEQLKGKTVVVIYETRDTVEQNRALKNSLTSLLAESAAVRTNTVVVPIINCSAAVWPMTGIWKANLVKNAEKEKIVIYGDWDGKMFSAYGMKPDASNILVIDAAGAVRFIASGKLDDQAIASIAALLRELAR